MPITDAVKLNAAREVILNQAVAFVRDHDLDETVLLARMQDGLNKAFAQLAPAGEDRAIGQQEALRETRQRDEGLEHGD